MSKFKVGTRVSMYHGEERETGTIKQINENGSLYIQVDGQDPRDESLYHQKQCRLLKKKERRRFWINTCSLKYINHRAFNSKLAADDFAEDRLDCIEVIEVRKNK